MTGQIIQFPTRFRPLCPEGIRQAFRLDGVPMRRGDRCRVKMPYGDIAGFITDVGKVLGERCLQSYSVMCSDGISRLATSETMESY